MVLSRRTFSALATTTALGLTLNSAGGSGSAHAAGTAPTGPAPGPPGADGHRHTIGFDKYSMLIDGRRVVLWSGEVHPFRLPSPSLWRDVLQKLRAHGYNAISIYVSWNYHSPAPGKYDFTGVRDLDLFLRMAAETGLYVILRPGPYINAEVDAGGFPGWLTATKGTARTSDPTYLKHVDEWLTVVDRIVARHLYSDGGGTVVLYQLENEYADHVTSPSAATTWPTCTPRCAPTESTYRCSTTTRAGTGIGPRGPSTPVGRRAVTCTASTGIRRPSNPRRTGATSASAVRRGLDGESADPGIRARVRGRLVRSVGRGGVRRLGIRRVGQDA